MQRLLEELKRRHQWAAANTFPSTTEVSDFANNLLNWLFPEHTGKVMAGTEELEQYAHTLQEQLQRLLHIMQSQLPDSAAQLSGQFMSQVPAIYEDITKDAEAI